MFDPQKVAITINGRPFEGTVDSRIHLADFLRKELRLTGTHLGCEHGVCGACTVLVDGASVRSCLMLAVQADGRRIETIEGVASADGALHPIQSALSRHHGLQCGYCTPGVVMTMIELGRDAAGRALNEAEIRHAMSGNLCRCTGYQGIVDAALELFGEAASQPEQSTQHPKAVSNMNRSKT
jgi:aerobic-type carbon monoxide dehydrogenase small subunit (CoxS/CutS family)